MVQWIFALTPDAGAAQTVKGVIGAVPVPATPKDAVGGTYVVEASYVDKGSSHIAPLTGHASITLRHRLVEAESAAVIHGSQVLGGGSASGRQFVGAINHHHHLKFTGINLRNVGAVTCRVASAGQGGKIEFRAGKPDGELLATVETKVTGGWETWLEHKSPITDPGEPVDLFIVFVNPGKSGLMNLDWVRFEPRE